MTNTKSVDALGFDRFQIAAIRRAYDSNKRLYKQMDTLTERIKALAAQYANLEEQAKTWEAPARTISMQVLGVELSPREILAAHADPQAFFEQHPELATQEPVVTDEPEGQETPSSEPEVPEEDPFN